MITEEQIKKYCDEIEESKKAWPRGEWDSEPNRLDFKSNGLDCLLLRNASGAWCGYVGLPASHKLHGKAYDSQELLEVSVHGGLTFASKCGGNICHVTDNGESVWWFGFDCAHGCDLIPGFEPYPTNFNYFQKYRNMDYAKTETMKLARQLKRLG